MRKGSAVDMAKHKVASARGGRNRARGKGGRAVKEAEKTQLRRGAAGVKRTPARMARARRRAAPERKAGVAKRGETSAAGAVLAELKSGDGCAALVVVAEREGEDWDQAAQMCVIDVLSMRSGGGERSGQEGGRRGRAAVQGARWPRLSPAMAARSLARACPALAACGHAQRARILTKLLEGPATYRMLQKTTRLKAGPLYHHVNQLRLAGLILPKKRDLYELTRGGRNLILTVAAAATLIRDKRARPIPMET